MADNYYDVYIVMSHWDGSCFIGNKVYLRNLNKIGTDDSDCKVLPSSFEPLSMAEKLFLDGLYFYSECVHAIRIHATKISGLHGHPISGILLLDNEDGISEQFIDRYKIEDKLTIVNV